MPARIVLDQLDDFVFGQLDDFGRAFVPIDSARHNENGGDYGQNQTGKDGCGNLHYGVPSQDSPAQVAQPAVRSHAEDGLSVEKPPGPSNFNRR